jgi:hypothetical protein
MESRGQLRDFLSHAVSLADQAAYVALPAGVTTWLRPVPAPEWIIVAGAILLALGCYETFRPQAREGHRVADALMVLGFMFALCVQKQVLRPHIAIQLIVYALVGSLLYAVLIRRRWTPAQSVAAGLFCGALLALYAGALLGVARTITRSPAELVSNWRVWNDRELRGRVNSEMFARSRFAAFKDATATVDVLERELGYTREDRAYVMGDDSFFYSLLGQDAPYNINHYRSSPIYEQRRVVDWLVRRRPRYVLWNPAVSIFDGVPHSVRVPLIYQHVVEHYAYLRSSGVYDILVRRNADAPMDSAYWRRRVGEMVDLGHVPRLSRVVSAPACTGGECAEVALVRLPAVEWRRKTSLRLMTDAGEFVVMFDVEPGVKEYATRLDRLWFWPLIRDRNGVSAALNERGLVERVRRHAADQLY